MLFFAIDVLESLEHLNVKSDLRTANTVEV